MRVYIRSGYPSCGYWDLWIISESIKLNMSASYSQQWCWELADPLQCPLLNFQEFWKYHVAVVGVVQSLGCVQLFVTPWTSAHQTSRSFSISQSLLKFMSIESVMPSNHLILCRPLLLLLLIFPSIRVFSNESAVCIRLPKYWSFSFSISPSKQYSGLISFRIVWFDLLSVQGTLKCLL